MAVPGWPDETKGPLLGSLPDPLVSLLIDNGGNTAVRLEAAFDTEAEAESLVTQRLGHKEARSIRRFWAKALMSGQAVVLHSCKVAVQVAAANPAPLKGKWSC